jgi:hypothetical protein
MSAGELCPNFIDHTPSPEGYLNWHAWAAKMSKTHKQRKCPDCGRFEIWEPKRHHLTKGTSDE